MGIWLGIGVATAVYGSHKITQLRQKALEARELGQYRLKQRLGFGGMGEVYLAEHVRLRRTCAIKLIRPEQAGDRTTLLRLRARGARDGPAHAPKHRSQSRRLSAQRWMAVGPSLPHKMPHTAITTISTRRCFRFLVCRGSESDSKYEPIVSTFTNFVAMRHILA
jgi:serine/threonine protein kinase